MPGVSQEQHERLIAIRDEAEILSALMQSGEISDLEALALLMDFAAPMYGDDGVNFLTDLGIVVGGLNGTTIIGQGDPMNQYYVSYAAFDPETTGFAHELNPNDENQVRHFLAGAAGYNTAGVFGGIGMYADEVRDIYGIFGGSGGSVADLRLYARSFEFAHSFRGGIAPLSGAGDWVLNNLGP